MDSAPSQLDVRAEPDVHGHPAKTPVPHARLRQAKLHAVLGFIDSSLNSRITVRDIAAVACLSPFHFSRAFTATVGCPPHAYLTLRRVEKAKYLLRSRPELSLKAIAGCVGYRTQTQLAGVFSKVVGISPARYRRGYAGR
jgi:AraC family transcriptional regulator